MSMLGSVVPREPAVADLSAADAERLFTAILDGEVPLEEVGRRLIGLARKGETQEEIDSRAQQSR